VEYGYEADHNYHLDTGDQIRVNVFELDAVSQVYAVDASGSISIPLGGTIRARGRTAQEVERAIAASLRDRYVKDPKVAVQVVAYRPFFILGEVRAAGAFPYVNGLTAEAAVAMAGGFTDRAERSEVRISRPGGDGVDVYFVPLGFLIRPGDTLYVPERWF
jgi:polysaccharide biosynthesis/export protein